MPCVAGLFLLGESMDFFLICYVDWMGSGCSSRAVMVMLEAMGFFSSNSRIFNGFLLLVLRISESLRMVDCLLLWQFSFSMMRWYLRITSYLSNSSKSTTK